MSADLPSSRRPLLDYSGYFEDGLDDGLVPPDPFAELDQQRTTIVVNNQQDDRENELLHDDDDDAPPPHMCIEKLGLILGVIIGVIVQLSALSGSFVNVTIWGTEDGPYATATFLIWCCVMSSVFFVAFYLLRYLVEKSLQMAYSEQEKTSTISNATTMVEDIPSDNPLPNPTGFPSLQSNSSCRRRDSHSTTGTPAKGQAELLEDVMWHMKLHYVLGVNIGISLSWIVTNLAIGKQRVSLIFALAPPALGMLWFWWMKGSNILFKTSRHDNSSFQLDPSQTLSTSFSSSLKEDYLNPLPTIPEEFDTVL